MSQAVSRLRLTAVARDRFWPVCVWFMVEEVALGRSCLRVRRLSPFSIILPEFTVFILSFDHVFIIFIILAIYMFMGRTSLVSVAILLVYFGGHLSFGLIFFNSFACEQQVLWRTESSGKSLRMVLIEIWRCFVGTSCVRLQDEDGILQWETPCTNIFYPKAT